MWTGPCFANSEINTTGEFAVAGWAIEKGTWAGQDLSGLKIAAAIRELTQNLVRIAREASWRSSVEPEQTPISRVRRATLTDISEKMPAADRTSMAVRSTARAVRPSLGRQRTSHTVGPLGAGGTVGATDTAPRPLRRLAALSLLIWVASITTGRLLAYTCTRLTVDTTCGY